MIRYVLVDINNNEYQINNESFKRLEDGSTIQADTIERSFKAGSVFPGEQRDESKEITFQYNIDYNNEQDYRLAENVLRMNLRKAYILKDIVNNIQTEILLTEHTIAYDDGGMFLGSINNIMFKQLRPFWEDIDYTYESLGSSENTIRIDNTGFIETPPIITIQALEQITKLSIRLRENGYGIYIKDLQFGTTGLNTYIIDNGDGYAELNGINRNQKISNNTGFFNLIIGQNTLDFVLNGAANIEVKWKRRFYL